MKISKNISAISALMILFLTSSCVETVVVGSVAGAAMVVRHKTVEETKNDAIIGAKLTKEFFKNKLKTPGNSVDFTINEGRVLLTGITRNVEKAQEAQRLTWKISGVKEVIDEIEVLSEDKIKTRHVFRALSDYLVTAKAEVKLVLAKDVTSSNYKITTVNGAIYLLGVADSKFEMRRVLSIASKIRGTTRVINHVILRDDNRRI